MGKKKKVEGGDELQLKPDEVNLVANFKSDLSFEEINLGILLKNTIAELDKRYVKK